MWYKLKQKQNNTKIDNAKPLGAATSRESETGESLVSHESTKLHNTFG